MLSVGSDRSDGSRGCTGFDGGFEVRGAIRRPWLRKKTEPKYKRQQQRCVSCLMQLVGLGLPAPPVTGIMDGGALTRLSFAVRTVK